MNCDMITGSVKLDHLPVPHWSLHDLGEECPQRYT